MVDPLNESSFFAAADIAVLATTRPNGTPRLVPITFTLAGSRLLTAVDHKPKSTRRLARIRDIEHDPRVSVLVHHYSADWSLLWWVRADGTAQVKGDHTAIAEAAELLATKYPQYRDQPPAGPVIDIDVTKWSSWSATDPLDRDG